MIPIRLSSLLVAACCCWLRRAAQARRRPTRRPRTRRTSARPATARTATRRAACIPILAGQTCALHLPPAARLQGGPAQRSADVADGRRPDARRHAGARRLLRRSRSRRRSTFKADRARKVDAGKKMSDEALCTMCHLGGFAGQNEIPRVAGQHYDYIVKQLTDFKAKRRTNDAGNMTSVAGDAVRRRHREPVALHHESVLIRPPRAGRRRCRIPRSPATFSRRFNSLSLAILPVDGPVPFR